MGASERAPGLHSGVTWGKLLPPSQPQFPLLQSVRLHSCFTILMHPDSLFQDPFLCLTMNIIWQYLDNIFTTILSKKYISQSNLVYVTESFHKSRLTLPVNTDMLINGKQRESRNKPTHLWSSDFQPRCQSNSMNKNSFFRWWWHNWLSIFKNTYIHICICTLRILHMTHTSELKMDPRLRY